MEVRSLLNKVVKDHLKEFELGVGAEPSDSDATLVVWCEVRSWHWHRQLWTYQVLMSIFHLYPENNNNTHTCTTKVDGGGLMQHLHSLAADRNIVYSKSKRRRAKTGLQRLATSVSHKPTQPHGLQTDAQSQNLLTNRDWRVMLSCWNLVYLTLQTLPSSRSTFTCGHCNVSPVSLSISERDYTGLHSSLTSPPSKREITKPIKIKVIVECWASPPVFTDCDS